jgi:rhodanese-related sulfurtransferase
LAVLLAGVVAWQVRPWIRVAWVRPDRLEAWIRDGLPMVVADIRLADEFRVAHIAPAVSVPQVRIPQMSRVWKPDQRIVLVCRSSYREIQIYHQLRRRGFKDVYCLSGGMVGWARYRMRASSRAV